MEEFKREIMKKYDYAIEKLKLDFKYEVQHIWELRGKVHSTMLYELIQMAKELRNAISLLNSENTEGVSDATHKSGVLHDVGKSHASGEDCKSDLASGELPLEKITEAKEDFPYAICFECGEHFETELDTQGHRCRLRKSD